MSDLDEMWAAVEAHQSRADERGYGDTWRKMCAEHTTDAARAAWILVAVDMAAASGAEAAIESINKAEEPKP